MTFFRKSTNNECKILKNLISISISFKNGKRLNLFKVVTVHVRYIYVFVVCMTLTHTNLSYFKIPFQVQQDKV